MRKFETVRSVAVPFARDNIDTDQILPARFQHMARDADMGVVHRVEAAAEEADALHDAAPPARAGSASSAQSRGRRNSL